MDEWLKNNETDDEKWEEKEKEIKNRVLRALVLGSLTVVFFILFLMISSRIVAGFGIATFIGLLADVKTLLGDYFYNKKKMEDYHLEKKR